MTVINVENLGKRYSLGARRTEGYDTFRNMLKNGARQSWQRLTGSAPCQKKEDFWAVRDLSFKIEQGQRVGIIGRNGAGKSTLLKLLSRITEPTEGRITLSGRVASLLEVGTGFHPELTGRENIYLNGAVLGMRHEEIRRKFDEIVTFAEVDQFLDTPVKRYSSGMYMRLAFAIAAHLEPEILIVDEVLAVGDAAFQKKCLGKMGEIGRGGSTILFVSHSMAAVQQLCNRTLWLEKGRLVEDTTDVSGVAHRYLFGTEQQGAQIRLGETRPNGILKMRGIHVGNDTGEPCVGAALASDNLFVHIEADIETPAPDLKIGYLLYSEDGHLLYHSHTTDDIPERWPVLAKGKNILRSKIPAHLLNEGLYRVEVLASLHGSQWLYAPNELPHVVFRILGGLSDSPHWIDRRPGLLAPLFPWEKVA